MEEEPQGRGAWGRRRTPQAAASVLLLIDSHPLVLNHMVSTPRNLSLCFSAIFTLYQAGQLMTTCHEGNIFACECSTI